MKTRDFEVKRVKLESGATLEVHFYDTTLANPGIFLPPPAGSEFWDFSGYSEFDVDVENLDRDQQIMLSVRFTNPLQGNRPIANNSGIALNPGEKRTLRFYYPHTGAETNCRIPGIRATPPGIPGAKNLNAARIDGITFWGHSLKYFTRHNAVRFRLSNPRFARPFVGFLAPVDDPEKFFPFIDRYGQYVHDEWPEKIHSDQDLIRNLQQERSTMPGRIANWSRFGGWSDGPQLAATGFFRTERYRGKWYLVDPEGYLFFSHGVNAINTIGAAGSGNPGWVEPDTPLYDGIWNFFETNLKRKYGEAFMTPYAEIAVARLNAWGLNTIGCWSRPEVLRLRRMPYVLDFGLPPHRPIPASAELPWGGWDPFEPDFAAELRLCAENDVVRDAVNDPCCIGFFTSNEIPWGTRTSVAQAVLTGPPELAAKQVLIEDLRTFYCAVRELNHEWGTTFQSWEELRQNRRPLPFPERAEGDLIRFNGKFLDRFYQVCRDTIKSVAPNQLYLGSRFNQEELPELYQAASRHCDVVSCNVYTWSFDGFSRPGLERDKPILITEFHVGVLDRGMFNADGRPAGVGQIDRALAYERLLQGALLHPQIVGTHYFEWADQCLTGRGDGENFAIGLVDVADTPYQTLVETMRKIGSQMVEYRLADRYDNR